MLRFAVAQWCSVFVLLFVGWSFSATSLFGKSLLGKSVSERSSADSLTNAQAADRQAVQATIAQLFDGMKSGDTTRIRATLDASVRLQTTGVKDGVAFMQTASVDEWLKSVATPRIGADGKRLVLDERILRYDVSLDATLASVWTPYQFYLGDKRSHCGANAFHLWKSATGWKILSITDTRHKDRCEP